MEANQKEEINEEHQLLLNKNDEKDSQCSSSQNPHQNEHEAHDHLPTVKEGFKALTLVAVPIFVQQFLRYLQVVCNYSFVSYIDDTDVLGGLGLALCFYAVLLQASLFGLNSSITITVPQLIGLKKWKDTGRILNAGRIVNTLIAIPFMIILIFSNKILLAFGQDESVAYQASRFLIGVTPCVWFFAQSNLNMYFLNSFKLTKPGLISSVGGLVIQIIFNCVFYIGFGWGLISGGISASIQNICQCIFMFGALYFYPETRRSLFFPQFNHKQWEYIKEFLYVGIPSLIMSVLYILGVEIMQPLAGNISSLCNGAQGIVMNMYYGIFTIFIGVSMATSIFVGKCMGQGNVQAARLYAKLSILLILIITAILVTLILIFKNNIVKFYTSNESIQTMAANALWIFCCAIVPDSILFSQAGTLRGMGKQTIIIVVQIVFTAGVSVPLGIYFAFTLGMNITGLWLGYLIRSVLTIAVAQYIVWYHCDWEQIAKTIKEENDNWHLKQVELGIKSKEEKNYGALNTSSFME